MRTRPIFDRRAGGQESSHPSTILPAGILRARAVRIVAVATFLVGLADYLTGNEIWFGPFYLLVIGLASWSLGWREGLALAITCMLLGYAFNGPQLYQYGSTSQQWNIAVRMASVLMVICLVDIASKHYAREWWRARTDPLTGVLNRQAFFELVGAKSQSNKWSLLAYADLDGLKKVNDQQGHAKGDDCLKKYASGVKKVIRKGDVFARIGGDEFLVHMVIKDEAAGKAVSRRLHGSMNGILAELSPNLRCSVGTVLIPPGTKAVERNVQIADELMYEAKAARASLRVATVLDRENEIRVVRHEDCAISFSGELVDPREETAPALPSIASRIERLRARLSREHTNRQDEVEGRAAA